MECFGALFGTNQAPDSAHHLSSRTQVKVGEISKLLRGERAGNGNRAAAAAGAAAVAGDSGALGEAGAIPGGDGQGGAEESPPEIRGGNLALKQAGLTKLRRQSIKTMCLVVSALQAAARTQAVFRMGHVGSRASMSFAAAAAVAVAGGGGEAVARAPAAGEVGATASGDAQAEPDSTDAGVPLPLMRVTTDTVLRNEEALRVATTELYNSLRARVVGSRDGLRHAMDKARSDATAAKREERQAAAAAARFRGKSVAPHHKTALDGDDGASSTAGSESIADGGGGNGNSDAADVEPTGHPPSVDTKTLHGAAAAADGDAEGEAAHFAGPTGRPASSGSSPGRARRSAGSHGGASGGGNRAPRPASASSPTSSLGANERTTTSSPTHQASGGKQSHRGRSVSVSSPSSRATRRRSTAAGSRSSGVGQHPTVVVSGAEQAAAGLSVSFAPGVGTDAALGVWKHRTRSGDGAADGAADTGLGSDSSDLDDVGVRASAVGGARGPWLAAGAHHSTAYYSDSSGDDAVAVQPRTRLRAGGRSFRRGVRNSTTRNNLRASASSAA